MSDILSPLDPATQNVTTITPQTGYVRQPFMAAGALPGSSMGSALMRGTGNQQIDQWFADWQQKNFGGPLDRGDSLLFGQIARSFSGGVRMPGSMTPMPAAFEATPFQRYENIDWSIPGAFKAFQHGFEESTAGALARWMAFKSTHDGQLGKDPGYDPYSDPDIKRTKYKNRPDLFELSSSNAESRWIIRYMDRHEKDASYLEAMTGHKGIFTMAGSLLGDPQIFAPSTLGTKIAKLQTSATHLASPGSVALGFKPVIWGGMADGLRIAASNAGLALLDAGMHSALDPNHTNGSVADIVTLPAVMSGAVGFLVASSARFEVGMDAMARASGNSAFTAGTRVKPARGLMGGAEGPAAPGIITPAEKDYWEKAAARNPEGRFHVDGMVMGHEGDNVVFKTSEGIITRIAQKDIDVASVDAPRGIVVSARQFLANDNLMASGMHLDGKFYGGGKPFIQNPAEILPGSLHTDYPTMRTAEHARSDAGKAMGAPSIILRTVPNEDPRGMWTMTTVDGRTVHAKNFPADAVIAAEDGGEFIIRQPLGAGEAATFYRSRYPEQAATGTRLVDQEFRPGELKPAYDVPPPPTTTSEQLSKTPGIVELKPKDVFHQEASRQRAYVVMPDGRMFEISEDFTKAKLGDDVVLGEHHSFFVPFGDLQGHAVTLTRFGNELAGDVPIVGRTPQQMATIRRLESAWVREGKGDQLALGLGPDNLAKEAEIRAAIKPGTLTGTAEATADIEIAKGGGSLSARAPIGSTVANRRAILEGNKLARTGIGIENMGLDLISRAANLPFTTWQATVEDLLSAGGRVRVKNTAAGGNVASAIPVEILVKTNWNRPTNDVIREIRDMWEMHRTGSNPVDPTDFHRIAFEVRTAISDKLGRTQGMRFEEFRRRVGDALINGDADLLADSATPFVNQAAAKSRGLLEKIKREADDVGLFREAHEEQVLKAQAALAGVKKTGNAAQILKAENHLNKVQDMLHDVIMGGPRVNTAKSYRPRIWLYDQLMDRKDDFLQIVDNWLRNTNPTLSPQDRAFAADEIHKTLTRDRPGFSKKEVDGVFNDLAEPGSAKARTFEIPDMLVKDFLENDVEALVRGHSRTMGTAIEMHRRFGSTGLEDQVAELHGEFRALMAGTTDNNIKRQLTKQHDLALQDLLAARDKLYGVYGVPDDPHRWQSRAVRMAKQFTNITVLGMSGVTAMADLMRPLMTEGLQAVHDYGYRTLASDVRGTILKMSRNELELAGDAMELIANTRALSMSDAGDMFRSRTPFERGLAKTNSWFFVANGLNAINQLDKEWAGVIIQGNINKAIMDLHRGARVEPWMLTRLAAAGLDEPTLVRIGSEMIYNSGTRQGMSRFGKLMLANSDSWADDYARDAYRSALNQMVNRTVPTPTLGDTPNWMSTELGTLMSQYKSFAFGALNRSLISGLQEETRQFWYGAAAMTGFAMILNEVRSRLMYDRSTFDKPMSAAIIDGVDRSGILGAFADANKMIEVLSNHSAGVRPFTGAEKPRTDSASRVIGTALGPAAGQATNALSVLGDFISLHPTARTMANARQLAPWQNVPYLDPVFDHLISDGSYYPKHEPRGRRGVNRPGPTSTLGPNDG